VVHGLLSPVDPDSRETCKREIFQLSQITAAVDPGWLTIAIGAHGACGAGELRTFAMWPISSYVPKLSVDSLTLPHSDFGLWALWYHRLRRTGSTTRSLPIQRQEAPVFQRKAWRPAPRARRYSLSNTTRRESVRVALQ
jgi:hypothetical protein